MRISEFKTRWRNHQMSFTHESERNNTELSKHIWQQKDQKKGFTISWEILTEAKSYTILTKRRNLCSTEKFYILFKPDMETLNKRNELISTCTVGTSGSSSLNSIASLWTNQKFTYIYCFTFEYCNGLDHVAHVYI